MMARVRGVIASSSRATSILKVRGSTSTNTGLAPASTMTLSVAAKVSGVVMTSSPGLSSSASSARCKPGGGRGQRQYLRRAEILF